MTGDPFDDLQQQEDGPGHMEGEEAQGKEEGDGDDGPDGFTSATGIWRVGT